jgi:hypothetical protein
MSEAATTLIPKPEQAEEEIKRTKEEYAKIISEGNLNLPDLTKMTFRIYRIACMMQPS